MPATIIISSDSDADPINDEDDDDFLLLDVVIFIIYLSLIPSPPVVASVFDSSSPALFPEEAKASPTFKTMEGEGTENIPITGELIRSLAVNVIVVIMIDGSEGGGVEITFIFSKNHTLLFKEF
jgi:hypothetical protein